MKRLSFTPSPVLLTDFYKQGHKDQYPEGTNLVYTNLTARGTRVNGLTHVLHFGTQAAIQKIDESFRDDFFNVDKDEAVTQFKRRLLTSLGIDVDASHIEALHDLQYLPIEVWALPEGVQVPLRVPLFCVYNTEPEFFWLTNFIETTLSANTWGPLTSATTARLYRRILNMAALNTDPDGLGFVPFQGHDFSYRGMFGDIAACQSGAGHLLSFLGTDTIPAIDWLEHYYDGDAEEALIGGSVWATEHSVMCMGGKEDELDTFRRLITEVYPEGIVSVVSDTWNLWDVVSPGGILDTLRDDILARDGKVVIRPDSGDPVHILCGYTSTDLQQMPRSAWDKLSECERKGVVECLWDLFGGSTSATGYKKLHECIGTIYGDSITLSRAEEITSRLADKGFASTNVVLGIGSFTYQGAITPDCIVTRDSHGLALKSTYGEVKGEGREIFKDPITDDGLKRSARGLIAVYKGGDDEYYSKDQATWVEFENCAFQPTFRNGDWITRENLTTIKGRVDASL